MERSLFVSRVNSRMFLLPWKCARSHSRNLNQSSEQDEAGHFRSAFFMSRH
jgi:hypothetical protein